MPTDFMNEIDYFARFGTTFTAHKKLGAVTVNRPAHLPDEQFAADCIEFGGWHGTSIHPDLVSFQGYDTTTVTIGT